MKRTFLATIFFFLIQAVVTGQSSESEPNNSFTTASGLLSNDLTTATLGGGDVVDYHGLHFNYNASLHVMLEITNTGSDGTQTFTVDVFNSLRMNGVYVGTMYNQNIQVDEGETLSYPITLCGLAKDSVYLKMQSTGDFEYTVQWYAFNSFGIDDLFLGYNNTAANATSFSFNVEKEGSIGYKYWGNTNFDSVDYYTTILPAANYDSVRLKIRAQNNQCFGTQWIRYFCYKKWEQHSLCLRLCRRQPCCHHAAMGNQQYSIDRDATG